MYRWVVFLPLWCFAVYVPWEAFDMPPGQAQELQLRVWRGLIINAEKWANWRVLFGRIFYRSNCFCGAWWHCWFYFLSFLFFYRVRWNIWWNGKDGPPSKFGLYLKGFVTIICLVFYFFPPVGFSFKKRIYLGFPSWFFWTEFNWYVFF